MSSFVRAGLLNLKSFSRTSRSLGTELVKAMYSTIDLFSRYFASMISSSPAPRRSTGRTSHSSWLNRQGRILPSAVMRSLLQAPQKGRVTDAMMPMDPGPPSANR